MVRRVRFNRLSKKELMSRRTVVKGFNVIRMQVAHS